MYRGTMTIATSTSHVVSGTTSRSDGDWSLERLPAQLERLGSLLARRHGQRPERTVWTEQVHGAQVLVVGDSETGNLGRADALVTDRPDVLLTVRTADCVPVFLESPEAVGIVHAGMAGALKQVFPRAVRTMRRHYKVRPEDLHVRFGPHICSSCYTMSERNLRLLESYPDAKQHLSTRGDRQFYSLLGLLTDQAGSVGIRRIEADARCTYHGDDLFSSRRNHDHRLLSYVMLTRTARNA